MWANALFCENNTIFLWLADSFFFIDIVILPQVNNRKLKTHVWISEKVWNAFKVWRIEFFPLSTKKLHGCEDGR